MIAGDKHCTAFPNKHTVTNLMKTGNKQYTTYPNKHTVTDLMITPHFW